jgi:hypothetical protein
MPTKTYKIPYLLWGGGKAIGHPEIKERLVGIADYKLKSAPKLNIQLTGLRNNPTYKNVDARLFLRHSEARGLKNKQRGCRTYYVTVSKLAELAEEVEE